MSSAQATKVGCAQDARPLREHRRQAQRLRVARARGLRHAPAPPWPGRRRRTRRWPPARRASPAVLASTPPMQRAGQRDQPQPGQRLGHDARAIGRHVQVAHHRARADHRRAHAHALQRAPGDQRADVGRHHAADAGQHEDRQPAQQHRPAAEAVGHRPEQQLAEAEGEEQRRQRQLRAAHRRLQVGRQAGQRRQVQVGGDRLRAQQQREQRDDRAAGLIHALAAPAPAPRSPQKRSSSRR